MRNTVNLLRNISVIGVIAILASPQDSRGGDVFGPQSSGEFKLVSTSSHSQQIREASSYCEFANPNPGTLVAVSASNHCFEVQTGSEASIDIDFAYIDRIKFTVGRYLVDGGTRGNNTNLPVEFGTWHEVYGGFELDEFNWNDDDLDALEFLVIDVSERVGEYSETIRWKHGDICLANDTSALQPEETYTLQTTITCEVD